MAPLFFAYNDNILDVHRFRDADEAFEHYAKFGDDYEAFWSGLGRCHVRRVG